MVVASIMIGSAVGERVLTPGLVPYSATKGAVKIFTQGLSREVGSRGITVNNVQPGPIDTDLNPAAGGVGGAAEGGYRTQPATDTLMRSRLWWRLSRVRSPHYITGADLTVDGGMNA